MIRASLVIGVTSCLLLMFSFFLIVHGTTTPSSAAPGAPMVRPKAARPQRDNICGVNRRCCAGWSRPPNATRCIIPVCSGGCGDRGKCMRPNLCLCPNGQMASTCTQASRPQSPSLKGRTHPPRHSATRPPRKSSEEQSCSTRCLNGGTCYGFMCICISGFQGPHCGQPVCSEPCRNGGKCTGPDHCLCPQGQDSTSCAEEPGEEGEPPVGPCYTKVVGKACKNQLKNVHCTKALCCSTVGRGWGRPCAPCPAQEPCRRGFLLNPDLNVCVDVDECTQLPDLCTNGHCLNTLGSFTCHCDEGFSYNPSTFACEDVDECDLDPNICGPESVCTNLPGSHQCRCAPGYLSTDNNTRCVANREGVCFNDLRNGECQTPRQQRMTMMDCCCTGGKGWTEFRACQMCPSLRSAEYRELCGRMPFRSTEPPGPYVTPPVYPVIGPTDDKKTDVCTDRGAVLCPDGKCIGNGVSYRCECHKGFEMGSSGKCVDIDECRRNGICMNGVCMNNRGSYSCICNPGFALSEDRSLCRDVDECSENGRVCLGGHCINTQGSFRCVCNPGFELSPTRTFCIDIDECRDNPSMCQHGRCVNKEGSFACLCNPGYHVSPDSVGCVDINECDMADDVCARGNCMNLPGSYVCQCPSHLILSTDGRSCQDVAKGVCYSNYDGGLCSEPMNALVTRVVCCCSLVGRDGVAGAFGTACEPCPLPGTSEYHDFCEGAPPVTLIPDINECILKPNICQDGDCEDLPTGYRCICHEGYRSDPTRTKCIDINECTQNGAVCIGGQCVNYPGGYHCTCQVGYRYDEASKSCQDIDECKESPPPCLNAVCFNTPGSFVCQCDEPGFSLDASNRACVDSRLGTCWASVRDSRCEDQIRSSILKIECCSTVGVAWGSPCEMCSPLLVTNATGTPTIGPDGKCPKGWLPHVAGMCIDINECQLFGDLCAGGGTCLNTQGSFVCQCPPGLSLDSTGRRCLDLRVAKCYAKYQWGRCESPYGGLFRKPICCCSVGSAWGEDDDCGPCPIAGSDAHKDLCLKGHGYGPTDPDDGSPFIDINECQLFPNLCGHGHCRNTAGSFVCICHQGYALDSGQTNCTDIDECRISPHICGKGRCENIPGSFICHCSPGYESPAVGQGCVDIDECSRDRDLCKGGQCINTQGSFACQCPDGHELSFDQKSCKDVDECSIDSGICSHGMCQNYMGGYECMCHHGYRLNIYKTSCIDVNECDSSNGGCDSVCKNTPGSFECDCRDGYKLSYNRHTCDDINECDVRSGVCDGGRCSNLPGKFKCECGEGYRQTDNDTSCMDIDECSENVGICLEGTCKNVPGSYRCECNPGYTTIPGKEGCHDCDECELESHDCDDHAECTNTPGSYKCTCMEGFSGDGHYCTDINECVTNNGGCDPNAKCINTKGSFECQCEDGYEEHVSQCIDINECDLEENLCINGYCTNQQGTYRCECEPGYEAVDDGKMCQDIDECSMPGGHVCQDGRCINSLGSFKCICNPGFQLDNNNCLDINECDNPDSCVHGTCINSPGGYECVCPPDHQLNPTGNACIDQRRGQCFTKDGCLNEIANRVTRAICCCSVPGKAWKLRTDCQQCPRNDSAEYTDLCPGGPGFTSDAINLSLEDINECDELENFCVGGECSNLFGSFICTCPPGYKFNSDNGRCEDMNECDQPDACGEGGTCMNTDGSHLCMCPDGYVLVHDKCTDMRQGTCYLAVDSSLGALNCSRPQSTFLTRKECCCTLGKAWNALEDNMRGLPCKSCPPSTSEEYQKLCGPSGVLHPDGGMDMDMDECSLMGDICQNGQCINTIGSFYCQCFNGYQYNELLHSCDDINECLSSPCPTNSVCNNVPGSYRCVCNEGYQLSYIGRVCEDIDECLSINGVCRNGRCENLLGSYRCICNNGFRQVRHECVDIDECAERPGICSNGTCQNLIGSHTCKCAKGFELTENNDCQDRDECSQMPGVCLHGRCKNDVGSFHCECQDGFIFNEEMLYCEDIDECSLNGNCANGICINTAGSFHCRCKDGYQMGPDGRNCIDKDECASADACRNGRCMNTDGGYRCQCEPGFELSTDGKRCEDHRVGHCYEMFEHGVCSGVREGRLKKDQCCCSGGVAWTDLVMPCQKCPSLDTEEFRVLCPGGLGFVKNGKDTFDDVNECEIHPGLCKNGHCINTDGSYRCQCLPGFTLDPRDSTHCIDVDECSIHSNLCGMGNCTNVEGSFRCECEVGYMPNHDGICEDINECLEQTSLCAFRCQNTQGSFQCMCPRGFELSHDMRHCQDIDECATNQHNCKEACKNTVGSFVCVCHPGYEEFGLKCRDIDECSNDPTLCKPGQCVNTPGSFQCTCPEGYKESTDQKQCIDVRMGACISNFQTGRCPPRSDEYYGNLSTVSQCCCSAGVSWGDECRRCSKPKSVLHKKLCPHGPGFDSDGNDIDECDIMPDLCANGQCINTIGSYRCSCDPGFRLDVTKTRCQDVNECNTTKLCQQECLNTVGSFVCSCHDGYVLGQNDRSCLDVDECSSMRHSCGRNKCLNTLGGFECMCNEGTTKHGDQCVDVDECSQQPSPCAPPSTCANKQGSYECKCPQGYEMSDNLCQRGSGRGQGGPAATDCGDEVSCQFGCTRTASGPRCNCPVGFKPYFWNQCIDDNECLQPGICGEAMCHNSVGSFKCICAPGLIFNENALSCIALMGGGLGCGGSSCSFGCTSTQHGSVCSCPKGYSKAGNDHCVTTGSSVTTPLKNLPHVPRSDTHKTPASERCITCQQTDGYQSDFPVLKRGRRFKRGADQMTGLGVITVGRFKNDSNSKDEFDVKKIKSLSYEEMMTMTYPRDEPHPTDGSYSVDGRWSVIRLLQSSHNHHHHLSGINATATSIAMVVYVNTEKIQKDDILLFSFLSASNEFKDSELCQYSAAPSNVSLGGGSPIVDFDKVQALLRLEWNQDKNGTGAWNLFSSRKILQFNGVVLGQIDCHVTTGREGDMSRDTFVTFSVPFRVMLV